MNSKKSVYVRAAKALGWPEAHIRGFSLLSLAALVRPADPALAAEIHKIVHGDRYIRRAAD